MKTKPKDNAFPSTTDLIISAIAIANDSFKEGWPSDYWISYSPHWDLNFWKDSAGTACLTVYPVFDGNTNTSLGIRII